MNIFSLRKVTLVCFCLLFVSWSPSKPKLFLIGDSISVQYWPYLKENISYMADIDRKNDDGQAEKNLDVPTGANGGDSRMVLEYLRAKFRDSSFKPDYLLLNCGLHDIKHDPKTGVIQVKEEDYRSYLNEIVRLLKKNKVKLVWIRTTWVIDDVHNKKSSSIRRYEADVLKYNAIADEVCQKNKIPAIDLYTFSKQLGAEQIIDHVHYSKPAQALQAAYISGFMQKILKSY